MLVLCFWKQTMMTDLTGRSDSYYQPPDEPEPCEQCDDAGCEYCDPIAAAEFEADFHYAAKKETP